MTGRRDGADKMTRRRDGADQMTKRRDGRGGAGLRGPGLRRPCLRGPGLRAGMGVGLVFVLAAAAWGQDTSSWFGGSITGQAYALGAQPGGSGSLPPQGGWSWGSATTMSAGLGVKGQRTRAEASFDGAALTGAGGAAALAAAAMPGSGLLVAGTAENALSFRLRTLWAKLDLDWATVQIGRQVVNYGRGALWSPEDIFASIDLSGATPDRLGSDAIRVGLPLGVTSGLDIVASPATDPGKGRYATRISGQIAGVDSGALGAWDGGAGRMYAAADCKFDLGPSFYAEGLWSIDPASAEALAGSWARMVGGLDWSVGDFIFAAEYYWNGGGAAAITDVDPGFPGRQYLYATALWSFSDFGALSLAATGDLEGLGASGGPLRITVGANLDASQNATIGTTADLVHGNFASRSSEGWTVNLGAFLKVKF